MKKLILLIAIVTGVNTAFSQTKEQAESFLKKKCTSFNKDAKITQVNNLDSVIRSCKKNGVTYDHNYFTFRAAPDGSFNPEYSTGGGGEGVIKSKNIPFVNYKTYKEGNRITIEVVCGSDSF